MSRSIESNKMDDSTAGSTYIRQDNSSSVPSTRLIESLEESNSSDLETSKDRFGGSGPVGKANAYEGKVQTVQRNRVVADRDSHSTSNLETRDRLVLETCARAVGNVADQLVVVTVIVGRSAAD